MLMGFGNGIGSGILMTLGADVAPPETRSQFLGVWRLCADSGSAGGPLVVSAAAALGSLAAGISRWAPWARGGGRAAALGAAVLGVRHDRDPLPARPGRETWARPHTARSPGSPHPTWAEGRRPSPGKPPAPAADPGPPLRRPGARAWCRSPPPDRTQGPAVSDEGLAAVDGDGGAGHEGVGEGEEDRVGDVVGRADAAGGVGGGAGANNSAFFCSPRASYAPVSMVPGEMALTRIGASSTASERATASTAPLVAATASMPGSA